MSPSAVALWTGLATEVALGGALLAFADIAARPARVSIAPAVAAGAVVGFALVSLLARRLPPPVRVDRARAGLMLLKGGVLAVSSAAEEVVWRWFAIGALAPAVGVIGAFALSTLGFGLAHGRRKAILVHLVTGAGFGAVYVATGRLAAAVAAHLAYNLCVLLASESSRQGSSTSASSAS